MLIRQVAGHVGLMIVAGAHLACGQPRPQRQLLYWGSDKLFVAEVPASRVVRRPVVLDRPIENIVSVSSAGNSLAIIGLQRPSMELKPFLVELPGGIVSKVVDEPALQLALSPDASQLAFTTNLHSGGEVGDIAVRDLATGNLLVLLNGQASAGTTISWHPNGRSLNFSVQRVTSESKDSETEAVTRSYAHWIKSADLETGTVKQLLEGSGPALSPDGKKLSYYRDGSLFVVESDRGESRRVYSRGRGQADFVGATYWSPAGDKLAVNVGAGAMEERLECLVIDDTSGKVASLGTSSYWCGPWVAVSDTANARASPADR